MLIGEPLESESDMLLLIVRSGAKESAHDQLLDLGILHICHRNHCTVDDHVPLTCTHSTQSRIDHLL